MSKKARREELVEEVEQTVTERVEQEVVRETERIVAEEKPKKMTVAALHEIVKRQADVVQDLAVAQQDMFEMLDDHEVRITNLERGNADLTPNSDSNSDSDVKEEKKKKKGGAKACATEEVVGKDYDLSDGPHKMWQYWDHTAKLWRGPSREVTTAAAVVGGDLSLVRALPVWIKNGRIDHVLTPEEAEKYLP